MADSTPYTVKDDDTLTVISGNLSHLIDEQNISFDKCPNSIAAGASNTEMNAKHPIISLHPHHNEDTDFLRSFVETSAQMTDANLRDEESSLSLTNSIRHQSEEPTSQISLLVEDTMQAPGLMTPGAPKNQRQELSPPIENIEYQSFQVMDLDGTYEAAVPSHDNLSTSSHILPAEHSNESTSPTLNIHDSREKICQLAADPLQQNANTVFVESGSTLPAVMNIGAAVKETTWFSSDIVLTENDRSREELYVAVEELTGSAEGLGLEVYQDLTDEVSAETHKAEELGSVIKGTSDDTTAKLNADDAASCSPRTDIYTSNYERHGSAPPPASMMPETFAGPDISQRKKRPVSMDMSLHVLDRPVDSHIWIGVAPQGAKRQKIQASSSTHPDHASNTRPRDDNECTHYERVSSSDPAINVATVEDMGPRLSQLASSEQVSIRGPDSAATEYFAVQQSSNNAAINPPDEFARHADGSNGEWSAAPNLCVAAMTSPTLEYNSTQNVPENEQDHVVVDVPLEVKVIVLDAEKQAEETAEKAAEEAAALHRKKLEGYMTNFLSDFQNCGICIDAEENPQEAKIALAMSQGLTSVLDFAYRIQRESEERDKLLRDENEVLRAGIITSRQRESDLEIVAEESKKSQKRSAQKDILNDIQDIKKKLWNLRKFDVTIENLLDQIKRFENRVVSMENKMVKFKESCNNEKRLLKEGRTKLKKEFRQRRDDLDRIDDELGTLENDLEQLTSQVRDLEATSQPREGSQSDCGGPRADHLAEDFAVLQKQFYEREGKCNVTHQDLEVFRDHMTDFLEKKTIIASQASILPNEVSADTIRKLPLETAHLRRECASLRKSLIPFFDETKRTFRKMNCHIGALHSVTYGLVSQTRRGSMFSAPNTNIYSHNIAQNEVVKLRDENEALKADLTDAHVEIFSLSETLQKHIDNSAKGNRALRREVDTISDKVDEVETSFDNKLKLEKIERMQDDFKELLIRANGMAVCGRYFNSLFDVLHLIPSTAPKELENLVKDTEKSCQDIGAKMQRWNNRIIKDMKREDATSLAATNDMVNKMRKGETLPLKWKKWSVYAGDQTLLQCLQQTTRRFLESDEFWRLKNAVSSQDSGRE